MNKIKQSLACLLSAALLGMPNFAYAKASTINSSETSANSSEAFEYQSIEENINRLDLELAEAELLEAECAFFRSCDDFKRCLSGAAGKALGCAAAGFTVGAWLGAAIAGGLCASLSASACSDKYRGAC